MTNAIKIKRGLNIKLEGEPQKNRVEVPAETYAVKPTDFIGVFPRLLVQEGDEVKAGTPLFCDKQHEEILFTSPVSGWVQAVVRGEKRVLEEIQVKAGKTIEYEDFGIADIPRLTREQAIEKLLKSGLWPCIRQRPYSIVANPNDKPKAIYISTFDSAPLAPDYAFMIQQSLKKFQMGLDVLAKLTDSPIHLGINSESSNYNEFALLPHTQTHVFKGKHPVGNVGVQIHHTLPINKGETVWVVNPQDVVLIGNLFTTGHYDASIWVAVAGSQVQKPQYYATLKGACVSSFLKNNLKSDHTRVISGNVLTGKQISPNGYLGFYHHQLTAIPEGDHYDFLGWASLGVKKYTAGNTFLSAWIRNRKWNLDTNLNGGHRSLVMTGQYERVFPMDIMPMQLIKACIIEDVDLMEKLGIYEVDEEDFALCEFIDASKTEIQQIIRKGLDLVRKEMS